MNITLSAKTCTTWTKRGFSWVNFKAKQLSSISELVLLCPLLLALLNESQASSVSQQPTASSSHWSYMSERLLKITGFLPRTRYQTGNSVSLRKAGPRTTWPVDWLENCLLPEQ